MRVRGPFDDRRWQGLALAATAPIASLGVGLGCLVRNMIRHPEEFFFSPRFIEPSAEAYGRLPGTGIGDAIAAILLAGATLAWIIAILRYIWMAPRSPLSIGVAIISLAIFIYAARQVSLVGYPVCSPF